MHDRTTIEKEPDEILCFSCKNYMDTGFRMCKVFASFEFAFICEYYERKGELTNG